MSSPAFFRRPRLLAGLLATAVVCSFSLTAQAIEPVGFKPIFNGKDLSGWEGDVSYWSVKDGVIIGQSTEENPCTKNTFLQWTDGKLDDFELKLEFRLSGTEQANSGIQFRSQVEPDGHVVGYQADMDRSGKWLGGLYDERGRGSLAVRGQSTVVNGPKDMEKTSKGDGDKLAEKINLDGWNEYHIIARGNQLTLKINGETMCTVTDEDEANRDLDGVLALQLHSGPPMTIEFRNIQLRRLPLEGRKKVVFVAGSKSHGYFSHEHNAGCLLLAEKLSQTDLAVQTAVYLNGWPTDVTAFDNADTVVCYCDGGGRHFLNPHLQEFDHVMARGTGLVCIHYAVETVPGKEGDHFLKWLGGYFEPNWSVNPHWTADFKSLPKHPITRGVKPFSINDEWYYHMRFVDGMEGVTPILSAMPPRETLNRKDGPHSNNPHVREAVLVRKEEQHVGWAYERDNNGRAFGFTGGHWHVNWQHDDFRKVVLNAIAWTAHAEVPKNGLQSPTPTEEEMKSNQDYPQPNNWKFAPPKTEVKQTATEKPAAQLVAKKKSLNLSTAAR
ncbi:MAG: family 16 glycoside hydrolase [Rubinisphaera brasiliensis]|uniref:family 16 glycoside hydrolase n=1 Tax=Rubinisphaera brasiliensis TaxID=119 RepID=UPI003919F8E3